MGRHTSGARSAKPVLQLVFGGSPGDPIADAIVVAFDAVFSAACEAAITAVGVFTEEACDEAIEKNLGLSC